MSARPARVAVVGAGIAGLSAAWHLARGTAPAGHVPAPHVTLFEAEPRLGGHAHTVPLTLGGVTHGVDTGFLVFNERTYPGLIGLFDTLGVASTGSEMSFSVQAGALEWAGTDLGSVFAQRRNLASPRFLAMLADILRFNRLATGLALRGADAALAQPVGAFLAEHRFGTLFRDAYFLPMIGSIWSCPTAQMLAFPVGTLIRFCHNHGLLQVSQRPRWFTVTGGSARYVQKMLATLPDVRPACPVRGVRRQPPGSAAAGVWVDTDAGSERFDAVVLATHAPQALGLLPDASAGERAVLGAIRTQPNRAVLHTDAALLPRSRRAWAAWNYEAAPAAGGQAPDRVCLHYLINRLQPLPWAQPVIVSLNPVREPRPDTVHGEYAYAHPVFDQAAIAAQQRLPALQGSGGVWFCGAWARYGFHEDGFVAGREAAHGVAQHLAARPGWAEAA